MLNLQSDQADVWRIFLDLPPAPIQRWESALSEDEAARAARFRSPADQGRYIVAHAALREILARYLDCLPAQLIFTKNEYGKPALKNREVRFNLSHSGEYALVAVARHRNVGVDVERIRANFDLERLAQRFFSPREASELARLPPERKARGFFNGWSRKEAYIKAHGLGLSMPLRSFDVSLDEPARLRATRPDSQEAARWSLLSLEIAPGYAGALAVEGVGLTFRLRDWDIRT